MIALIDRLPTFFLYATVFFLPFSISLTEIFTGCLFVAWLIKRVTINTEGLSLFKRFLPIDTELNSPILIFLAAMVLSAVFSVSLPLSVKGLFLKVFKNIALFFICAEVVSDRKKIGQLLAVMGISAVLVSADAIVQFITGTDFIYNHVFKGELQGPFNNPNSLAGWLVVISILTITLAYFLRTMIYGRIALWVLASILTLCLVLTYSRGAWIAFAVSMIILGIIKKGKFLLLIMAAAVVVYFLTPSAVKMHANTIFYKSEPGRISLWKEAFQIIEDFPVSGCGINTYAVCAPNYRITDGGGCYPHNCYLQMAAETGILGLSAFLYFIFRLFKISFAALRNMKDRFYDAVLSGLLMGLLGFLIHSFFDTDIYALQLGAFMWVIMGLVTALGKTGPDIKA